MLQVGRAFPYNVAIKDLQLNPVEPLCEEMPSEFTILLDKGRWYICFSIAFEAQGNQRKNCIGVDPGVRTFLTCFDGENVLEIGNGSISKIVILCQRLDKLQSQIAKSKLDKIHLGGVAQGIGQAFQQITGNFYHLGW